MRDASLFKIAPLVTDQALALIQAGDDDPQPDLPKESVTAGPTSARFLAPVRRTHPTKTWDAFAILQAISTIPSKSPQA